MTLTKSYSRCEYSTTSLPILTALPPNAYPPTQKKKGGGSCFMSAVIMIFVFEYSCYVGVILLPLLYPQTTIVGVVIAVVFHILFLMTVIAYIRCVKTDPGRIPRHWAFYRGDVHKRQRYCRQCNVWKPDRTHHCSFCSRCVLNMDHHCPWIDNCVGFYNRKFFLQLLLYGVHGLGVILAHSATYVIISLWSKVFIARGLQDIRDMIWIAAAVLLTGVSAVLFFAMAQFTSFHVKLVSNNLTTIENLDYTARERGTYDLGLLSNCQQVFGPTISLWWLPCNTLRTAPVGDGVRWTLGQPLTTMDVV